MHIYIYICINLHTRVQGVLKSVIYLHASCVCIFFIRFVFGEPTRGELENENEEVRSFGCVGRGGERERVRES
jgi:hypothetical protein